MISSISFVLRFALLVSLCATQPTSAPVQEPAQPVQPPPESLAPAATSTETTTAPSVAAANSTEPETPPCFYEPATSCANITGDYRCSALYSTPGAVLCCDIDNDALLNKSLSNANIRMESIEYLHIRNLTVSKLNVGSGTYWEKLVSLQALSITDGSVTELKGQLPTQKLTCLNLSENALTQLPNVSVSSEPRLWLDISGNNKLPCQSIIELMNQTKKASNNKTELQFARSAETYCLSSRSFHWFNSTEHIPLSQVEALNSLAKQCPTFLSGSCTCTPAGLDLVAGRSPTYSVQVDCSGRGLAELPPHLPPNTIMLNVSDNRICNISALIANPAYKGIRRFFADNNTITSIQPLEGSLFIQNFVELSLRSNNISALPIYFLSNVFDRNWEARTVNLGQNRLKCDCSTAQTVKFWLINHKKHVNDYNEVLCENMAGPVAELDQSKLCLVPSDWTDYIYYVIGGEVAVLCLLFAKVSYDYWKFKTAGYLPWPASKMPKLPCDWVFE